MSNQIKLIVMEIFKCTQLSPLPFKDIPKRLSQSLGNCFVYTSLLMPKIEFD